MLSGNRFKASQLQANFTPVSPLPVPNEEEVGGDKCSWAQAEIDKVTPKFREMDIWNVEGVSQTAEDRLPD